MSEEQKSYVKGNFYVPHILPEWENQCNSEESKQERSKIIQLTDENASNYAETTSRVGWKRRVDYALKNFENIKTMQQDSTLMACLLENVISTVIVLASNGTLPDEYLINSYVYLRNIRNEFGENPPNISNFLDLLKTKASEEVLSWIKSIHTSELDALPSNLIVTRVPKALQKKKMSKQ